MTNKFNFNEVLKTDYNVNLIFWKRVYVGIKLFYITCQFFLLYLLGINILMKFVSYMEKKSVSASHYLFIRTISEKVSTKYGQGMIMIYRLCDRIRVQIPYIFSFPCSVVLSLFSVKPTKHWECSCQIFFFRYFNNILLLFLVFLK